MITTVCISIGVYVVFRAVEMAVAGLIGWHRKCVEKDVARLVMLLSDFKSAVEEAEKEEE